MGGAHSKATTNGRCHRSWHESRLMVTGRHTDTQASASTHSVPSTRTQVVGRSPEHALHARLGSLRGVELDYENVCRLSGG
jgi:hypothetical protein